MVTQVDADQTKTTWRIEKTNYKICHSFMGAMTATLFSINKTQYAAMLRVLGHISWVNRGY